MIRFAIFKTQILFNVFKTLLIERIFTFHYLWNYVRNGGVLHSVQRLLVR